jgi:hypothetical protein
MAHLMGGGGSWQLGSFSRGFSKGRTHDGSFGVGVGRHDGYCGNNYRSGVYVGDGFGVGV